MKDIARELGVSVVTVSKVLRNHADIGEETRQRVLKRVKELNYQPNPAARALVTGRTYTAGLIVPDLVHPFFAEVATGLSNTLRRKNYCLLISSSQGDPELERQEIKWLLSRRLDALVIASTQWTVESFRRIEEQKTPYILIDRAFLGLPANFVGVDDIRMGRMATEHLIAVGCRRIAHIRGAATSTAVGRLEGYSQALSQRDLTPFQGYVVTGRSADADSWSSGNEAMKKLLGLTPPPDGVFCYNDPIAIGVIDAILDAGLRVPQDVAVIGCGNLHFDKSLRVPLSSVDQQSTAIGERAGKLLLSVLEAKAAPQPKSIMLEPRLVQRESTRRSPDTAGS
ncbi:MAG TPA: LacI family DNA-binding transcriptional regulator [Bryobacteraceae bacterium]|nr:LacI family DNA-binding transcriptional regulator [Bryobacteraceae bacterium]